MYIAVGCVLCHSLRRWANCELLNKASLELPTGLIKFLKRFGDSGGTLGRKRTGNFSGETRYQRSMLPAESGEFTYETRARVIPAQFILRNSGVYVARKREREFRWEQHPALKGGRPLLRSERIGKRKARRRRYRKGGRLITLCQEQWPFLMRNGGGGGPMDEWPPKGAFEPHKLKFLRTTLEDCGRQDQDYWYIWYNWAQERRKTPVLKSSKSSLPSSAPEAEENENPFLKGLLACTQRPWMTSPTQEWVCLVRPQKSLR